MLQRLLFNLGGVTPEIAGGVSNVCQTFVTRIPESLPGVEAWALTGPGDWQHRYPLSGRARLFSIANMDPRHAGKALEKAMDPSTSGLSRWFKSRLSKFRRETNHRFPASWSRNTVVHCPYQVTHPLPPAAWDLPYVINLHDIQHEHFPEFFTPEELAWRRETYLASARHASAVCVVDEWTKRDVLAHLPIPEEKIFVAPIGPTGIDPAPLTPQEEAAVRTAHGLPEAFAFYPAQTWPHKNHGRLLEAIALLKRERGLEVDLVCTGRLTERHPQLEQDASALGISGQVHFLGLVPGIHIQALYRMARLVVIPTLFEGGPGIPVLEAMSMGRPLAASTACGIPDAVGDAGLLFDPASVSEMALAMATLWENGQMRQDMGAKALLRSHAWRWEKVAQRYADIYREALARWNAQAGRR